MKTAKAPNPWYREPWPWLLMSGPALVIVGAKDTIVSPARAREMASLMPKAKVVELANAGHLANVEAPQEVNAALGELVSAVR